MGAGAYVASRALQGEKQIVSIQSLGLKMGPGYTSATVRPGRCSVMWPGYTSGGYTKVAHSRFGTPSTRINSVDGRGRQIF